MPARPPALLPPGADWDALKSDLGFERAGVSGQTIVGDWQRKMMKCILAFTAAAPRADYCLAGRQRLPDPDGQMSYDWAEGFACDGSHIDVKGGIGLDWGSQGWRAGTEVRGGCASIYRTSTV